MYCASRPLLETVVRQRLAELDGVTIRDDTQFTAYRVDSDGDRVGGVRVRGDDGIETLEAEVVVDATGRTSRTPAWLAENGYDPQLGARPLRRTIQREVEDKLSEKVLFGEYQAGQLIVVDVEEDELTFRGVDSPPDTPPVELAGSSSSGSSSSEHEAGSGEESES